METSWGYPGPLLVFNQKSTIQGGLLEVARVGLDEDKKVLSEWVNLN